MLKELLFTVDAVSAATTCYAQAVTGRSLGAPLSRTRVFASQETALSGSTAISATVAPLTNSGAGFGTTKLATPLAGFLVSPLAKINVTNPTDQGAAVAASNARVSGDFSAFKTRVSAWLVANGQSTAVLNYTREIRVNTVTGPKERSIAFNLIAISAKPPRLPNRH